MTRLRHGAAAGVVALVLGLALGAGCSGGEEPELSDPDVTAAPAAGPSDGAASDDSADTIHVAEALDRTLVVRSAAQSSAEELVRLSADDQVSGKIICLVVQQVGDWVEVTLPTDDVGRTGWVAREDVAISRHRFRIEVSHDEHTLTLYTGEDVALSTPVALGPDAPEAGTDLFIKELVEPPDPAGVYRRYAYGLSGAANDADAFASGRGVVAVHGVADPDSLGEDVPDGSIGVGADIVTRLADSIGLPLGTPVDVVE